MSNTREIKFRCFDNISPKMYTGHSLTIAANGDILFLDDTGNWVEPDEGRIAVMQFTGLKDKNGKEIYEGDVVESNCTNFVRYDKAKVIFSNGAYQLELPNRTWVQNWNSDDIWVIGNIYENPELLKSIPS